MAIPRAPQMAARAVLVLRHSFSCRMGSNEADALVGIRSYSACCSCTASRSTQVTTSSHLRSEAVAVGGSSIRCRSSRSCTRTCESVLCPSCKRTKSCSSSDRHHTKITLSSTRTRRRLHSGEVMVGLSRWVVRCFSGRELAAVLPKFSHCDTVVPPSMCSILRK